MTCWERSCQTCLQGAARAYLRVAGLALPAVLGRVLFTNLAVLFLAAARATEGDWRLAGGLAVAAIGAEDLLLDKMIMVTVL